MNKEHMEGSLSALGSGQAISLEAAEVKRCLLELDRVHFTVSSEIVITPEEFSERLNAHAYDLIVAEYPSPNWQETQALELLNRSKRQIPLIFVGRILQRETVAEFITRGAYIRRAISLSTSSPTRCLPAKFAR